MVKSHITIILLSLSHVLALMSPVDLKNFPQCCHVEFKVGGPLHIFTSKQVWMFAFSQTKLQTPSTIKISSPVVRDLAKLSILQRILYKLQIAGVNHWVFNAI